MLRWFHRRGKSSGSYSNEEWVESLRPPPDEVVLQDLRNHLVTGLRSTLQNYVDRDLNDFVEDITQDSVLRILDKLETFNGESTFTTWAMKVAVRQGYTELRRKRYKDISLEQYSSYDPG
jgi:RNA polymerase sigma-70 factor, ECF subfamily